MSGGRHIRFAVLACIAASEVASTPLAAQRAVSVSKVRPLDTSMAVCSGDEPAYRVSMHDGSEPVLECLVALKPALGTATEQEVSLRIDLVDADGRTVEMADSEAMVAHKDPPWIRTQGRQIEQHLLRLENRRPKGLVGRRFRIRVGVDSTNAPARVSPVFQLDWSETRPQPLCKEIAESPKGRDGS
jgi:hypothetical protein